ncbi:O-antigen ligase family protein [Modestobacter sp. VKM Ac-2977]|uniref:O-antigen ligase family protein n=1 Tax=Modestobacter sp. VKM Ac-2977 TaxID=3004131 RepID=UPI0022AB01A4|nr:O-antigen ligase family protein [Modestobacter sp. VKM Ac-2977]MCZ2822761.1 O-antigen ligase family protein [Modestobacter sp. VKM Ac-2977]
MLIPRLTTPSGLLTVLALTVLWIPAGRYSVVGAPAALPWRLVVLGMLLLLFLRLALDRSASWRPSPFVLVVLAVPVTGLLSLLANVWSLDADNFLVPGTLAVVQGTLLLTIFVVTRQLVTTSWAADWLLRLLVVGAGIVALSVGWERATGFNIFINLHQFLPLQLIADAPVVSRFGTVRALGSANHPIALSVMLVMLLPVAAFLARHSPWPRTRPLRLLVFLGLASAMVLAAVLTGSRTFVVMVGVMMGVLLLLDRAVLGRMLVAAVPVGVVALLAVPGTVLNLVSSFTDPSALIESQYSSPGWRGSGRLADLGPSLVQAQDHLWFGTGVGSRIVTGAEANAQILDNQYLSTLLESGLLGLLALLGLLFGPAFMTLRLAWGRDLRPAERHLALALGCAFLGYAVSAFFFDAMAFQQTVMVFLMLLAVASWLRVSVGRHRTGRELDAAGGTEPVRETREGPVAAG